jgi:hypothetical protein
MNGTPVSPTVVKVGEQSVSRLHRLGDTRLALVDDLLIKGSSSHEIATIIQEEWHENTDVSHDAVRKLLDRYRAKVLAPRIAAFVQKSAEEGVTAIEIKRVRDRLDVLSELVVLFRAQRRRLGRILQDPKLAKVPSKAVCTEMDVAVRMLKEIGSIQMETGVLRRAPKQLTGTLGKVDEVGRSSVTSFFVQSSDQTETDEARRLLADTIRYIETEYSVVADVPANDNNG